MLSVDFFELVNDAGFQILAQGLNRNTGNDLGEEAADDESACLGSRNTAGHEVEDLKIIEAAYGCGVACPHDLAGLDLQVRDRIGACAFSKDEIVVGLVGIGVVCILADQNVADPAGTGFFASRFDSAVSLVGALQGAL